MEAGPALGGQLTAAVASVPRRAGASGSAIRVVSTPARRGERARHTHRQYPIAPGSVSAPSESVPRPHRRRLRRGVRRARLVPQLPADSRTERTDVRTDSDRRLGQTGPLVAGTCPLPARTGGPRVDGPTAPLSPLLPHPANGPDGRPPPRDCGRRDRTRPGPVPPPLGATALANECAPSTSPSKPGTPCDIR